MGILSTIKKDLELVKPIDTIPDPNDPALTAYDTKMEAALAEEQKHTDQRYKELENLKTDTMASIDSNQAKQEELVQSGLNLQEQKLNNEIDKAEKSMRAEKADAYADYQKEIDPYGVNAEYRAAQGLNRSGYSESAKVAAFTAYQHRVATARAAFEQAKTEYNIAMEEAKQSANVELANISANSLQQKLTAAMQFFTMNDSIYNNSLANRISIENLYSTQKNNEWEKINKKLAAEEDERRWKLEYRDNKVTKDLQNQLLEKENVTSDLQNKLLQKEIDAYDQQSNAIINPDGTGGAITENLPAGVESINSDGSVNLKDDLWRDETVTYDKYSDSAELPIDMGSLKKLKLDHYPAEVLAKMVENGELLSYELGGFRRFCLPDSEEGKKLLAYRESQEAKDEKEIRDAKHAAWMQAQEAKNQQNQGTSQGAAQQSSSGQDSSKPWDKMTYAEKNAQIKKWKETGHKQTTFSSLDEEKHFLLSIPNSKRTAEQKERLSYLIDIT